MIYFIINIVIFYILIYISLKIYIYFSFNNLKKVNEKQEYKPQKIKDYTNFNKYFGPINNEDTNEIGLFKLHPFSHPNDLDISLAKINNGNMVVLDCGGGYLGTTDRILKMFENTEVHVVNKANEKQKEKIITKINDKKYNEKVTPHFIDFREMLNRFDEKNAYFDRIIFIESLTYCADMQKVLNDTYKLLKDDGLIYIRAVTRPDTDSEFVNRNIEDIEEKLETNLVYHKNIVHYLQNAGYKNISYASIPLIFSANFTSFLFLIPLIRYKLFNFENMYTVLSLTESMFIATK